MFKGCRGKFRKLDERDIKVITGAETINISLSGNAACPVAVSGSAGITIDSQGGTAFQVAINNGAGLLSAGAGPSILLTNAPAYSDLEGEAYIVGGSVSPKKGYGFDKVIMPNNYSASIYTMGWDLSLPFSSLFEEHGEIGNTYTLFHSNFYDFLESLKFKDVDECL